jgi:proprotein convertase subtilisin/kexin type 5
MVSSTNFYLSLKTCVVNCPSGTYGDTGNLTCYACTSPCGSCTALGNTSCSTCATGYLIYGTNTCGACPSNQFPDTSKTCALCDSNCLTCSSTPTNCLSCGLLNSTQSYLNSADKKCYVNCPSGVYNFNDTGNHKCLTCTSGCASCFYNTTSLAI